jgi:hypothetical protein
LAAIAAAVLSSAHAENTAIDEGGVWTLLAENDQVGGTDQHYTAGWKLGRAAQIGNHRLPARLLRAGEGSRSFFQLSAAQQIYTPEDNGATEPLFDQHPFAGWLYLEGIAVTDRGPGRPIDQIRLQLGVVGPWAKAEDVQNTIHRLTGADEFEGWENQIGNQVGGVLNFDRRWTNMEWQRGGLEVDVTPHAGVSLGNVLTSLNGGVTMRFGSNLDRPFGRPRNEPGDGGIAWFGPGHGSNRPFYGFVGIEARAVAQKIWLDGRPFEDDIVTQDSRTVNFDLEGGVVMPLPFLPARMTASYVRRSRTFEGQDQQRDFGTISFSTRF